MMGRCREAHLDFGIVWYSGKVMRNAGSTVRISDVIHAYEDGRMDILTLGQQRFQVLAIVEEKAYFRPGYRFSMTRPNLCPRRWRA